MDSGSLQVETSAVLVAALLYLPSAAASVARVVAGPRPLRRRATSETAVYGLACQISILGVLYALWNVGWWSLPIESSSWSLAFGTLVGTIGFGLNWLVWYLQHRLGSLMRVGDKRLSWSDHLNGLGAVWPRGRMGRLLGAMRLIASPIAEELATRVILVGGLAGLLGSWSVAVAIGVLTSVVIHLHQGPRKIPHHVWFFLLTWSLVSFVGVWSAVVCHVLTDLRHAAPVNRKELLQIRRWARGSANR